MFTDLWSRVRAAVTLLSRLRDDRRGNVAPMFALAVLPVLAFVGTAVDYSRGNAARTAMQAALDSTALMLSKDAQNFTQTQLQQKASAYFTAMFTNPDAKNVTVTPTFTSPLAGSFTLTVAAAGAVDLKFMGIMGQSTMNIGASSEVKWGIKKLELALVLDNTGSMQQSGKMTALKTASKTLLTTLRNAAKKLGDVKVAIIPFDVTVKIGNSYKDEFWVNFNENNIGKNSWQGCVQDRDRTPNSIDNNVKDTTPVSGNSSTYFPAVQCGSLVTAMPLTDVFDATGLADLNSKIDAMTPAGNTNTTIGLVWGWHALTPNLPFTQAADPAPDLDKVIIMLTDGDNTQDRWSTSQSAIDARMAAACANVKATNIKVYTVRVINGDATLLRGCATNPGMYYDVQQASQLNGVFSSIAQNLASLRISK